MTKKHWIICYDIANSKRLYRVEKIVSSYAWRIQKSVFESDAPDDTIGVMKKRLGYVMDEEEDSVMIFDVCDHDWQKRETLGKSGTLESDSEKVGNFIIL